VSRSSGSGATADGIETRGISGMVQRPPGCAAERVTRDIERGWGRISGTIGSAWLPGAMRVRAA